MIYRFGSCELDDMRHAFRVDGCDRALEPQVFDLLHLLLRQPGRLVTRDALVDAVWNGRIVSEATISARINAVRRAVGDDGKEQRLVRTVPRRGIQLVCPVTVLDEAKPAAATPTADVVNRQRVRFTRSRDGAPLAFATTGQGPPLLRGSHWLSHLELDWLSPVWRPLLDTLGREFSVTRWDQRGTGLSGREPVTFDLERMTDDLEAVADAAGLERFPIFAPSQAVPVAVNFAARRPERVSRLVLYGGFAVGRLLGEDLNERRAGEAFQALIRVGWGQPDSAFVQAFATMFMPDATREQLDSFVRIQLASASGETAARLRDAILRFDLRGRMEAVSAPTLVIHARSDTVQPLDQAQLLAASIPGAELLVLESRNHVPLPHDPAWGELVAATRTFLLTE